MANQVNQDYLEALGILFENAITENAEARSIDLDISSSMLGTSHTLREFLRILEASGFGVGSDKQGTTITW